MNQKTVKQKTADTGGTLRIVCLIENRMTGDLRAEHGLSLYMEYLGRKYLLDTGASGLFLENAGRLGIDMSDVDMAILSHVHYDHSGGYDDFFSVNRKAVLYLREEAHGHYFKIGPVRKYIGIPEGLLKRTSDRLVYVHDDKELSEGVWLVGHKSTEPGKRGKKMHMYCLTEDGMRPDDFHHEQSLVFETQRGIVILNSCSHAGIDTIVEEVKAVFPGREVLAVIGGFHLMGLVGANTLGMPAHEIAGLARRLKEAGVKEIYTGHCTGLPAFEIMKETLGDCVHYLSAGTELKF